MLALPLNVGIKKLVFLLCKCITLNRTDLFIVHIHPEPKIFEENLHQIIINKEQTGLKSNNTKSVTVNPILNVPKRSITLHRHTNTHTNTRKNSIYFSPKRREKKGIKNSKPQQMWEDEWHRSLDSKKVIFFESICQNEILCFLYKYKRMISKYNWRFTMTLIAPNWMLHSAKETFLFRANFVIFSFNFNRIKN